MNLVIFSEEDDITVIDPDAIGVAIDSSEPDFLVSLEGIAGPKGEDGAVGPQGPAGSIGAVNAVPPLYYTLSTNTLYLDISGFDSAGAAAAALISAKAYTDSGISGVNATVATKATKYTHNQLSASNSWAVVHNLNTKPIVNVLDSANSTIFGDITYDDLNNLHINFNVSLSGTAYLR